MNGEYLRGEVYWICLDDSVGGEEKTGRPGVIVSADGLNEKSESVTIAFLSKQGFNTATRPSIADPKGGRQRVLCDQLRTVDKSRLTKYMHTLDKSELVRVTGALACTFCIAPPRPEEKREPEDNDQTALRCEADMWHRMYEKVMDQLVEIRVAADMAKKTVKPKPALPEPDLGFEEEEPKLPEEPKPKKNEKTVWDGVKVNVNTVPSATELKNRTGMAMNTALEIIKTRKIVGKYDKLDDLLALDKFGERSMKRYGHMLTVGEPEPEGEAETEKKTIKGER